jgi:hypothetical protein
MKIKNTYRTPFEYRRPKYNTRYARAAIIKRLPALKMVSGKGRLTEMTQISTPLVTEDCFLVFCSLARKWHHQAAKKHYKIQPRPIAPIESCREVV